MPTATHLNADVQETELSQFLSVFGGLGDGCTVHVVPSQRCTTVVVPPPTAVHARGELHDTP